MHTTNIWKHIAAFIYDLFPVIAIILLSSLLVLILRNGEMVPRHTLWFDILIIIEIALYYIYSWKIGGQTLGMRAWKLKIISTDNTLRITWTQSVVRFITGVLSTLLLGTGLFWKYFSKKKLSWMDITSHSKTIMSD